MQKKFILFKYRWPPKKGSAGTVKYDSLKVCWERISFPREGKYDFRIAVISFWDELGL